MDLRENTSGSLDKLSTLGFILPDLAELPFNPDWRWFNAVNQEIFHTDDQGELLLQTQVENTDGSVTVIDAYFANKTLRKLVKTDLTKESTKSGIHVVFAQTFTTSTFDYQLGTFSVETITQTARIVQIPGANAGGITKDYQTNAPNSPL